MPLTCGGAGEGNRTLMTSLEGCGSQSAEVLRPRSGSVRQCRESPIGGTPIAQLRAKRAPDLAAATGTIERRGSRLRSRAAYAKTV